MTSWARTLHFPSLLKYICVSALIVVNFLIPLLLLMLTVSYGLTSFLRTFFIAVFCQRLVFFVLYKLFAPIILLLRNLIHILDLITILSPSWLLDCPTTWKEAKKTTFSLWMRHLFATTTGKSCRSKSGPPPTVVEYFAFTTHKWHVAVYLTMFMSRVIATGKTV